jgi:hypothetical protein
MFGVNETREFLDHINISKQTLHQEASLSLSSGKRGF